MALLRPQFSDIQLFLRIVAAQQVFALVLYQQNTPVVQHDHKVRIKLVTGSRKPEGASLPVHISYPCFHGGMKVNGLSATELLAGRLQIPWPVVVVKLEGWKVPFCCLSLQRIIFPAILRKRPCVFLQLFAPLGRHLGRFLARKWGRSPIFPVLAELHF